MTPPCFLLSARFWGRRKGSRAAGRGVFVEGGCLAGGAEPLRLPSADTHGLRLAHHAARLGAALAFCDRCPCSVSLHPPQAALDSAAPKGEPLTGSRVKPPLIGEVSAKQTEGWEPSCNPAPCGQQKIRRGQDPALQSHAKYRSFLIRKEPKEF